ncbi:hypothetical protein [Streptomyces sp. NPDC097619]|uniref:hypothetical protein n=1 Tax=Streptomyces sp. NPDC097619 TaxID=3157228 RepID=UPI00331C83F4
MTPPARGPATSTTTTSPTVAVAVAVRKSIPQHAPVPRSLSTRTLPFAAAAAAAAVLALPAPAQARPGPEPSSAAAPAPCVSGEGPESRTRNNSVDEGEIRWSDGTVYDDARAFAVSAEGWSYRGARIAILPDTAVTSDDLAFVDYNGGTSANAPLGSYQWRPAFGATDRVRFNRQKLNARPYDTRDFRRFVALHEIGHALGLCHKATTVVSLMWKAAPSTPVTWVPDTDKANYRTLWGSQ